MYDLSPMMVQLTEHRRSFTHFLTGVCAIVGGDAANVNIRVQASNAQGLGTRLNHSVVKISLFLQCYS